jgi:hypothetical protein
MPEQCRLAGSQASQEVGMALELPQLMQRTHVAEQPSGGVVVWQWTATLVYLTFGARHPVFWLHISHAPSSIAGIMLLV